MTSATTNLSVSGGTTQTFSVPQYLKTASLAFAVAGGGGNGGSGTGGQGSIIYGSLPVSYPSTITVKIGSKGTTNGTAAPGYTTGGAGGGNSFSGGYGGGGGGSSAVIISGVTHIVGGGGGGGGTGSSGGRAQIGTGATGGSVTGANGGKGGSATSGGAGGTGTYLTGAAGTASTGGAGAGGLVVSGGGGGGGYYGGGGGGSDNSYGGGGGGGGSSYISASVTNSSQNYTTPSSDGYVAITYTVVDPPLAPTLTAPADGAYVNTSASYPTFAFTYNANADSGPIGGYCFRMKLTSASSYSYWNGAAWQSSTTGAWIANTTGIVTIASTTAFTTASAYNWSVANYESTYNLGQTSPIFATDRTFVSTGGPIVSSVSMTTSPPFVAKWLVSVDAGYTQEGYRAIVYSAAQAAIPGFVVGTSPSTYDSGYLLGTGNAVQCTAALANGGLYYLYVQAGETGGILGSWTSISFTAYYNSPGTPGITVSPNNIDANTGLAYNTITVLASDNLLNTVMDSFESNSTTGWSATNATLAASNTVALDGIYSMRVTASNTTAPVVSTATGVSAYTIAPGATYAAMCSVRAGSTTRNVSIGISWFTSAGVLISTSTGSSVTESASAWTTASVTDVAPSNAVYASLVITYSGAAASELHYIDCVGIRPNYNGNGWRRGGLTGLTYASVYYSDDAGATWALLRGTGALAIPSVTQIVSINDYECPPNSTRYYQAFIGADA